MATITPESLVVGGVRLETAHVGPPPAEAPTIVLLHEGLGSVSLWGDFPEKLAEATGLGVFAWSRAGHGGSDPCPLPRPLDYMEREATGPLPALLEAIGFRRGLLVGHSDGASIAALHLGHHQDHRVRGLVLMAPHLFVEDVTLASIRAARVAYESGDLRQKLARHHANVDVTFRGWNDAWLDPGFRDWDIRWSIGYVRVPILAIQGEADPYGTVAQIDAIDHEAYCPVERLMLPGGGHSPHRERPAETVAAIADLARRLADDLRHDGRPSPALAAIEA